jgi:hypothetical protein
MEDLEIISMWKAQNDKIEQTLTINKKLLTESINQKAYSTMLSLGQSHRLQWKYRRNPTKAFRFTVANY